MSRLETLVSGASGTARINVFDADGQLINSSFSWPVLPVNIADRGYFKDFKNNPKSPEVIISLVHSRFARGWTTVIARKVVGRDGTFLGVISRGMSPASFETFFESLAFGDGAAISMLHRDGTMIARYPHIEHMIGQNFSTAPMQKLLREENHGSIRVQSPVDGEDRLASARTLSQFPLSVLATVKVSTALADWRAQTRLLVGAAGLSALVIALTLFLIVRKLSAQHQNAEQRLALEKERLDTAVNNMSQGLLLYDEDARIVLFNQRYLDMYGLSREVVKPGVHFCDLIAYRKRIGSFKGDVDAFCERTLRNVAAKKATHNIIETPDGRAIEIVQPAVEERRMGRDPGRHYRAPARRAADRASGALRRADRSAEPRAVPRAARARA